MEEAKEVPEYYNLISGDAEKWTQFCEILKNNAEAQNFQ
jgi:hypothetical protein